MRLEVGCPYPPDRNDIVTPRHFLLSESEFGECWSVRRPRECGAVCFCCIAIFYFFSVYSPLILLTSFGTSLFQAGELSHLKHASERMQ